MNAASAQAGACVRQSGVQWWWTILIVFVCFTAISPQSLWNDEALTAMKAMQPSLSGWWHTMLADKASDLQMPLYMIYMWGWAKIFGVSELALRAANIPWFASGVVAFMIGLPGGRKYALAAVALISPFAWYYLGEARPYAMQLGASLMIVAALYRLMHAPDGFGERKWFALFCIGLVSLSGSSLLGMIWAVAACLAAPLLWSWKRLAELARAHLIILIPAFCLLAGFGFFYLWTLKIGARASDVGRTDWRNIVFILYELLGFGGLGPGRLEIRDGGLHAFTPFKPWLIIYAALIFDLLRAGFVQAYRSVMRPKLATLALLVALPAAIILGAGYVKQFRVLGRHFMPMLPVVWLILWLGLKERWSRYGWVSKPIACGFVVLSLISCFSFRFAARHKRDDYRDAALYAKSALQAGQTVWWNAGLEGALYYHVLIIEKPDKPAHALWLMNPASKSLHDLPLPDLIIISKPDVYDGGGAIGQFVAQQGYSNTVTLPAVTIWQRKPGQ